MRSLPTPPDTPLAANPARVDGCPRCLTHTVTPWYVDQQPDRAVAWYVCPVTGYRWRTSWAAVAA